MRFSLLNFSNGFSLFKAREKTLAHVDAEIVEEMKRYEVVLSEMKAIAHEQGFNLGT